MSRDQKYYQLARQASLEIGSHPGLKQLQQIARRSEKILDFGCGEGTRLNTLLGDNQQGHGVDINRFAISSAKRQYPHHHFKRYSGQRLPYQDNSFDLVYSAFVLEHTTDPEVVIKGMIRVTKPNGKLVILCPNFGAPNRRSPNSVKNPITKLITGLIHDFLPPSPEHLPWTFVNPKDTYDQPDDDTTVEPYLLSLKRYLTNQRMLVDTSSSLWSQELTTKNPRKLLFKFLGERGLFPFNFWGPQVFIIATKPADI